MRFAWIQGHEREFEVRVMCHVLQLSKSGYYAWKKRPVSQRRQRRQEIVGHIRQAHRRSRYTYGSPRICLELKDAGVSVCENTVARYMHQEQIVAQTHRRFKVMTTDSRHEHPVAQNLLERRFDSTLPDRKWCCDITYVPTGEGWLYLACVIDLCSRKIVGWATADHLRAELCTEALELAIEQRRPEPGLPHHSDRGVQYACDAYRQLLDRSGMQASMSRKGHCYDNAVMESFFKTLKTELIHHQHYPTRSAARLSIFEYIEVFYNRQRRHSAIGYLSPERFEAGLN